MRTPTRLRLSHSVVTTPGFSAASRLERSSANRCVCSKPYRRAIGHEHVNPLGAARLHVRPQLELVQRLAHEVSRLDAQLELAVRRVEVEEDEVGTRRLVDARVPRVHVDAVLLHHPEDRLARVEEREVDEPRPSLAWLRLELPRRDPVGHAPRRLLLEERLAVDAVGPPLHRERPVAEVRDEHGRDAAVVVEDIALRDPALRIENAVGARQLHLAAHSRRASSGSSPSARHAVRRRPGGRRHDLAQLGAVEHETDAVVGRVARREAIADEPPVHRAPPLLAVVVRAGAPGKEAEPVAHPGELGPERVGHAGLEPADHPRAPAAEQHTGLPGLAQERVEAVHAPDREHVRRVAAADEDRVLARARARAGPVGARGGKPRARRRRASRSARRSGRRPIPDRPSRSAGNRSSARRRARGSGRPRPCRRRRHPVREFACSRRPYLVGRCAAVRYVYAFDEDSGGGRELLGGKGIGLAEMTGLGVPVPGRLHDHHRRVPRVHGRRRRAPRRARRRDRRAHPRPRGARRASASAIPTTRCSSPSAPARPCRCRG